MLTLKLQQLCQVITPRQAVVAVVDDPDDNKILECALSAEASVIVSGDAHLLKIAEWQGIRILSPSAALLKFIQQEA